MSGAAQPPPLGQPPRKGYLLAPIACRHRERSRGMILRAAAAAAPGRVAVLGAGAGEEVTVPRNGGLLGEETTSEGVPVRGGDGTADARAGGGGGRRI